MTDFPLDEITLLCVLGLLLRGSPRVLIQKKKDKVWFRRAQTLWAALSSFEVFIEKIGPYIRGLVALFGYGFIVSSNSLSYLTAVRFAAELLGEKGRKTVKIVEVVPHGMGDVHDETLPTHLSGWATYQGVRVRITQSEVSEKQTSPDRIGLNKPEELRFHFLTRNYDVVSSFMGELRSRVQAENYTQTTIYGVRWGCWNPIGKRTPRPTETLFYPGQLHTHILEDFRRWESSADKYARRGRVHKRGYLLYGVPGTGKTQLALWLAGQTQRNVSLMVSNDISDAEFLNLVSSLPRRSILLLEDVDTVLGNDRPAVKGKRKNQEEPSERKGLSLGFLLNVLDGVLSTEGQVIVMTTNHPEKLDPALIRPGRTDYRVEIPTLDKPSLEAMYTSYFGPQGAKEFASAIGGGSTGADIECLLDTCQNGQEALAKALHRKTNGTEPTFASLK